MCFKLHNGNFVIIVIDSYKLMSKTLEAIHTLENSLKKLLVNYEFLKEENEVLLQQVGDLQHQISENQLNLKEKEKDFELLKFAKTINGSEENTRETKLKINALIREIDK